MPASNAPTTVSVSGKVSPDTLRELKRLAGRRKIGHCTLVSQIVEAYVKKLVECDACGHAHPIYHVHVESSRR